MPPKPPQKQSQMEMFERELDNLVNPEHPLVKLGKAIDWTAFEKESRNTRGGVSVIF